MSFQACLSDGAAKRVLPDPLRAKSLFQSSNEAVATAQKIPLEEVSLKSIMRELYEGLRQHCEAIGYLKGCKFETHEAITHFIMDVLNEKQVAEKFDRYRKIRNGINYYGRDISIETVKEALAEIPKLKVKLKV